MRLLSLVFFIPLLASVLRAQVPDNSPEDAIRDALDQKSDFYGSGIMDKQLSRMGDAAAVAITKVIAGKKSTRSSSTVFWLYSRPLSALHESLRMNLTESHGRHSLFCN